MSKKGTTTVHTTLTKGQGVHAGGQGMVFGDGGLEEAYMKKEKKKVR